MSKKHPESPGETRAEYIDGRSVELMRMQQNQADAWAQVRDYIEEEGLDIHPTHPVPREVVMAALDGAQRSAIWGYGERDGFHRFDVGEASDETDPDAVDVDPGTYYLGTDFDDPLTNPDAFTEFHKRLTANQFIDPTYIAALPMGKKPLAKWGGGDADHDVGLNYREARRMMAAGFNVLVRVTGSDLFGGLDVDYDDELDGEMPETLTVRTRSGGIHSYIIPTVDGEVDEDEITNGECSAGEWQWDERLLMAPGSVVATFAGDAPSTAPGQYIIETNESVQRVDVDDLPAPFDEAVTTNEEFEAADGDRRRNRVRDSADDINIQSDSSLYDFELLDDELANGVLDPDEVHTDGTRFGNPWHSGDRKNNTRIEDYKHHSLKLTCWRCSQMMTPIQIMAMLSGRIEVDGLLSEGEVPKHICNAVGTTVSRDDDGGNVRPEPEQMSWLAFLGAKQPSLEHVEEPQMLACTRETEGGEWIAEPLVDEDDPIPLSAIRWLAHERFGIDVDHEEPLPDSAKSAVISIIHREFGVDTGRERSAGGTLTPEEWNKVDDRFIDERVQRDAELLRFEGVL